MEEGRMEEGRKEGWRKEGWRNEGWRKEEVRRVEIKSISRSAGLKNICRIKLFSSTKYKLGHKVLKEQNTYLSKRNGPWETLCRKL